MGQLLNLLQGSVFLKNLSFYDCPKFLPQSCLYNGNIGQNQKHQGAQLSLQGSWEVVHHEESSFKCEAKFCDEEELDGLPHIQTLREFPKEDLLEKIVMVSCHQFFIYTLFHSIAFLVACHQSWTALRKQDILLLQNLSDFKEEIANCSKFSELLSSEVDIFVNDSFSQSHKVLSSTVGVTRFCYACIAGFHFEESQHLLKKVAKASRRPYVAIIGGGNLCDKATALHFLASRCEGLVFVGMMSFQIMHALGLSVPFSLVEHKSCKKALDIVQLAHDMNVGYLVDLGPVSLHEIGSFVSNHKKIIWIGPVKFNASSQYITYGASKVAEMLDQLSQSNCDVIVVGNMACQVVRQGWSALSTINMIENASVVWEFLKGRKLPGVTALDRAYPFEVKWKDTYSDPSQPLVVDIGSGNGLFLLEMARRRKDLNFLGLEINEKLVRRCMDSVHQSGIKNGYFLLTNATSTFRSIISNYPGELVLVSIQCPNPDFNKPENRWRMLQRSLVEAIVDLLTYDGKIFLQSDIEAVAMRMKEEFLKYGKGKLHLVHGQGNDQGGWLEQNPFGVRSDWEQHVIERGGPMYRLMFSKSTVI
ncbi:Phosphoglycerate kinase [Quillaja saponaria]|uniref:Phosphoglycerate kinase n=1 Tax=Quillaja saponaria TaxID=32244 RepID=A0AAD7Q037_QUISA|nr:Phosphoglycerate kinase [Quillaja saponaria]